MYAELDAPATFYFEIERSRTYLVTSSQECSNHSPHLGVVHHSHHIGPFVCVHVLKHRHADRHIGVHLPWLVCVNRTRPTSAQSKLDANVAKLRVEGVVCSNWRVGNLLASADPSKVGEVRSMAKRCMNHPMLEYSLVKDEKRALLKSTLNPSLAWGDMDTEKPPRLQICSTVSAIFPQRER